MSWDNEHDLIDADNIIKKAMSSAANSWWPDSRFPLLVNIFEALLRMGKMTAAKQAADMAFVAACQLDAPYSRAWSLGATTKAFAQWGDTEAAKKAADEAFAAARQEPDPHRQSDTLTQAIAALTLVGKIDEAITAARMIRDPIAQSHAFASIAEAMVKLGDRDQIETIIDEGLAASRKLASPGVRCSYAVGFFIALTKIGKADEAKRELDEMYNVARKIEGPQPRARQLFRIFDALVQVDKLDEAAVILDEMASLVLEVEELSAMPQYVAAVAEAKVKLGKEGEAKSFLNEVWAAVRKNADMNFKAQALMELSKEMIRFGMIDEATKTLEEALSYALNFKEPDRYLGDPRSYIIIGAVSVLAAIGEIEQAQTITEHLVSPSSKVEPFMAIATAMSNAGRVEEAKRLIGETLVLVRESDEPLNSCHPVPGYRSGRLLAIAGILVKMGEMAEARSVALEALAEARNMRNSEHQAPALIAVAEVLSKCSDEEAK